MQSSSGIARPSESTNRRICRSCCCKYPSYFTSVSTVARTPCTTARTQLSRQPRLQLRNLSLRTPQPNSQSRVIRGRVQADNLRKALLRVFSSSSKIRAFCSCFRSKIGPAGIAHQTHLPPNRRQPLVGIVNPQMQPELRPRREHPVRLVRTLADQIVNQNPDIPSAPAQTRRRHPLHLGRRIQPGNQPLATRFLISRRPIDLPRQKQPLNRLHFQRMSSSRGSIASYSIA